MAKKTHAPKAGKTLEQREKYHQDAIKRIQVKKQIETLRKSLKS